MAEAIASTTSTLPAPAVVELSSDKELDDLLRSGARAVVHCWAPWAAPCAHMNTVLEVLHTQHPTLTLARIQAEQHPTVAARYSIRDVPHILFLAGGRVVRQLTGADAPSLTRSAAWLADATDDALLTAACESLKCSAEIVVIIKGVVSSPRCAFSRQVIEILQARGIVFKSIDILSDGEVRERMKEVAAWETYPMVFARGRFVGGVDAIVGLADEGRLVSELARGEDEDVPSRGADDEGDENTGIKKEFESVDERGDAEKESVSEEERVRRRMEGLSKRGRVMVFMKGNPETPRCGFSRRIVGTLREHEVEFESFDVLEDNEVRQGMKTFSKWPTFPQVYAEGRFVGGLDVINELVEMGELRGELGLPS